MELYKDKINLINEYCYEGQTYYCVVSIPSGRKAIFDHNENILDALIKELSNEQTALYPTKSKTLQFKYPHTSKGLSAFLYGLYNPDREHSEAVIRRKTIFLEDGTEDCRSCNLISREGLQPYTYSRDVDVFSVGDKKYIRLQVRSNGGAVDYYDYSDGLYCLLATPTLTSFTVEHKDKKSPRVLCTVSNANGERVRGFSSQIAYYWYKGMIDTNDYVGSIKRAREQNRGLTIDHLNSDVRNQCEYNLSVMTASQNAVKSNLAGVVKAPCYLYTAVKGDKYIAEIVNCGIFTGYFSFDNADLLNNFLRNITGRKATIFHNTTVNLLSQSLGIEDAPSTFRSGRTFQRRSFEHDTVHAYKLLSIDDDMCYRWQMLDPHTNNIETVVEVVTRLFGGSGD